MLARFPASRNWLAEKESRQINMLEHVLFAKPLRTPDRVRGKLLAGHAPGGRREIAHVRCLDRRTRSGLGGVSHQPDSSWPPDRGHIRRPVLARLDLRQRAPRPALSRWLGAGRRYGLADLFSHRQDGRLVAEISHALAEVPYFYGLSGDRRLHLSFGFLSAEHRLRMGTVDGVCAGGAERHIGHLPHVVAAGQAPDRRQYQL